MKTRAVRATAFASHCWRCIHAAAAHGLPASASPPRPAFHAARLCRVLGTSGSVSARILQFPVAGARQRVNGRLPDVKRKCISFVWAHLAGDGFVNGLPLQRARMLCPDTRSSARSSAKHINSLMAASHNARDTERVQHRRGRDAAEGRSARITVARDRRCHADRVNA
jgi:hypothetical protein